MNALILAAGKGERLKEITTFVPKPMILVKEKPILQYNIELCKKYGITNLFINTHHHSEQIKKYFGSGEKFGVTIKYSFEEELLGTSGAINNFRDDLGDSPFFVIYGDQFSEFNLLDLVTKYSQNPDASGVIAFHYREDTSHSGVAEFDEKRKILKFVEKPKNGESDSHWVNAGIYLLKPEIIDLIPEGFSDFGKQIFPEIINLGKSLYGVCEEKIVNVFDTPEMYNKTFERLK